MISPFSKGLYQFSTKTITARTYAKFQEKYAAHLEAFKKKTTDHHKES